MKHLMFPILLAAAAVLLIPALVVVGCGDGEETTTAAIPTTAAAPAASTSMSESPTTEVQVIDQELVGIWANGQGIELEFTSDGVIFLRYKGAEGESPYSAKDGKISFVDFEPNEEGEFLPAEVEYRVDGDILVWDVGGGGELTLTRR